MKFLEELAARRRFGMKPGLGTIRSLCAALGDPQKRFRAIHVAGTNGKGAVCAMLDAALHAGGRYTSPHLVRINERFFLDGEPVDDATLDRIAEKVNAAIVRLRLRPSPTFFEALTAVAFELYAEAGAERVILECGLGGRLDATNVCEPELCVITRIGLDHCDWLGDTVEKIAAEKAGIVKPGVPVVLGANAPSVRAVVEARARELGAPFHYAPDLADESEIPADFSLAGPFNRENAVTALAALKVLSASGAEKGREARPTVALPSSIVWPGRFQTVGSYLIDGAHNPPAARALAAALDELFSLPSSDGRAGRAALRDKNGDHHCTPTPIPYTLPTLNLIFGACGDKDVDEVLRILKPYVGKAYAVRTNNPRSLSPEALAARMEAQGISATPCRNLAEALSRISSRAETSNSKLETRNSKPETLICGSLFLAGEAIVALNACPWPSDRFDPSERL